MEVARWIVSYDISDHRDRTAVAHRLHALGPRLLYSTFEIALREPDLRLLIRRLAGEIRGAASMHGIRTCSRCELTAAGTPIEAGQLVVVAR